MSIGRAVLRVLGLWGLAVALGQGCLSSPANELDRCLDYCELLRYCNNASDSWTEFCNKICYLSQEPGFSLEPRRDLLDCVTDDITCAEFLPCVREASDGPLPGDDPDDQDEESDI